MRQRKLRNLDAKYEAYSDIIVDAPAEMRGRWAERSGGAPLFIEIGCGKGKFISELAGREPEHFFVAIEGNKSVMLRAMEKIREAGLRNVAFIPELAGDLSDWFEDGEADGIYLNFSDPWPKARHSKRRLTSREFLARYEKFLKDGGILEFKTDNRPLFDFSVEEFQEADHWELLKVTYDLHRDPVMGKGNVMTEYEKKFSALGNKIGKLIAVYHA